MWSVVMLGYSSLLNAATVGSGGVSTAFSQGSTSVGIVAGSGSAFQDDYIILGLGVGYYVVKGLEIGVDAQYWFSGDPYIAKLSPNIRYVFTQLEGIKPYAGAFYRRTYFGDINGISIDDQESLGYRAGAYISTNNGVYIGGGVVHEEYLNCTALIDCSTTYPEVLLQVSF